MYKLLRMFWYGRLINYHMKKKDKFPAEYKQILGYHYEMAQYYYEKCFGEKWTGEKR